MSKTEGRAEARKEADGHDTQQVEENVDQDGVDEAKPEEGFPEDTDGERTDYHVGRQPLRRVSWEGVLVMPGRSQHQTMREG